MKINLQTPQFKPSEDLIDLVDKKVAKLFKQNPDIIRADIILKTGESHNLKSQYCEINLAVTGEDFFVKKNADKYEKAIAEAVEALSKMMRRQKDQAYPPRYAKKAMAATADNNEGSILEIEV
ncbi:MAG: HPF/RaiA family ribosome-associated protein [Spirosomataceae bacterium]